MMTTTTRKATATTMPSRRPSKQVHGRSRPGSTNQRRARRQKSPRSLLLLALIISSVAVLMNASTALYIVSEYRRFGHIHLNVVVVLLGIAFAIVAVATWQDWWNVRRNSRAVGSLKPMRNAKNRSSSETRKP